MLQRDLVDLDEAIVDQAPPPDESCIEYDLPCDHPDPALVDARQCAIYSAVVAGQCRGEFLTTQQVAKKVGLHRPEVSRRVGLSQRWRHHAKYFLRLRSRTGIECVLSDMN